MAIKLDVLTVGIVSFKYSFSDQTLEFRICIDLKHSHVTF